MLKNDHLPFAELPQVQDLPFEAFPAQAVKVSRFSWLVFWAIFHVSLITLAVLIAPARDVFIAVILAALPLTALSFWWAKWSWQHRRMSLREHDVLLQSGVWFRATRAQSLQRVQHVKLAQGPLQRRYGLATLTLYSSGSDDADFTLADLDMNRATQLRDYILGHGKSAA